MGRALVVAALVVACPVAARADEFDDGVGAIVGMDENCQNGLDVAVQLLDIGEFDDDDDRLRIDNDRTMLEVLCPALREDISSAQEMLAQYHACTDDCGDLQTAIWFILKKTQVDMDAVSLMIDQVLAVARGEEIAPVDTGSTSTHSISLATIGVSIDVPGTWDVSAGDGADVIVEDGVEIGAVMVQGDYDCATTVAALANAYDETRDVTISVPYAWSGVEFTVDGTWGGLYCRDHDGASLIVSAPGEISSVLIAGIEAALYPTSTETTSEPYVSPTDPSPTPETPRRRSWIGGYKPRTAQLALVRRSDTMGAGFGFGLQLGRLGWREGYRFTIGYEVAAAATSGFWNASAQVRPGFSPMLSDLPVDAYVALGVDAVGGDHQPETDVAPVGGVGAEVLFTLPGLGADLAAQVLADPGGFHSYLLHGGLLFGAEDGRFRVGASYVKSADDSSTLWMTLGLTMLELD